MYAVGADDEAGGDGRVVAVGLGAEADSASSSRGPGRVASHVDDAGSDELGSGVLSLFRECLVEGDAVDGDGAGLSGQAPVRWGAAEGDLGATLGVDEGAVDPMEHGIIAEAALLESAERDKAGAVGRDADGTVLLEEEDVEAAAGEVAGRAGAGRAGADDGDVAVSVHTGVIIGSHGR